MRIWPWAMGLWALALPAAAQWSESVTKTNPAVFTLSQESKPPGLFLAFWCVDREARRHVSLSTWSWKLPTDRPLAVTVSTQRGTRALSLTPKKEGIGMSFDLAYSDVAALWSFLEEKSETGVTLKLLDATAKTRAVSFPGDLGYLLFKQRGTCGG